MDDIFGIASLLLLTFSCGGLFLFGFTFNKTWHKVLIVLSGPALFALGIYLGCVYETLAAVLYGLLLCVIVIVWSSASDKS
jgi:hypothetical protein